MADEELSPEQMRGRIERLDYVCGLLDVRRIVHEAELQGIKIVMTANKREIARLEAILAEREKPVGEEV